MFLERGVASCSFGSAILAVRYVTMSASYLPDSELDGKGAGKNLLTSSPKETKQTSFILKGYYSV
jgi:hypothetical protein